MPAFIVATTSLLAVLVVMFFESRLSKRNESRLRAAGAIEPPGDVYATMQWAYPAAFVGMGVEGMISGPHPGAVTLVGLLVIAAAKGLKYWAIASLGPRWTFRVLVLPGAPLVEHGPYAYMQHPNYVGVVGELAGMGLLVGAAVTCPVAVVLFSLLLRRRMRVEDGALRHLTCS